MDSKPSPPRKQVEAGTPGTKVLGGEVVLASEKGNRFYHKHLSPKARKKKRNKRKMRKKSRR